MAVRDYNELSHLESVLRKTNLRRHDIVVVTVRVVFGAGRSDLRDAQLFDNYERELFTRVVAMAEKEGKTVDLLVVPGIDPYDALVQTAARLKASRLLTGVSANVESGDLAPLDARVPMSIWVRIRHDCGRRMCNVCMNCGWSCPHSSGATCIIAILSVSLCDGPHRRSAVRGVTMFRWILIMNCIPNTEWYWGRPSRIKCAVV